MSTHGEVQPDRKPLMNDRFREGQTFQANAGNGYF
jgi:hypothetical protein